MFVKKGFQTYPIQVEYNLSCGADIWKKANKKIQVKIFKNFKNLYN